MREKVKKEYIKRVKQICKTELTPKNKITAINQLAVPVVSYGFGIIDWPQKEIDKLDVKTRKILTMNKVTYRNQCMVRIYLPRREGGLGLTEINQTYRGTIVSLGQYLLNTNERMLKAVALQHQELLPQTQSIIKQAKLYGEEILICRDEDNEKKATVQAKCKRKTYNWIHNNKRIEEWREHKRAGKFHEELDKSYIDKKGSLQWLQDGKIGFDGERMLVAAQDQGLLTNGFKKMAGISNNDKCRFCHTVVESSSHLLSGCKILMADGHYTSRHNKVCRYLHWKICHAYGIETKPVWEHEPEPVTSHGDVVLFYDKPIMAGRYIENSAIKPDIVIWDRKEKTAQIVEVTVPNDFGLNRAEREKVNKYQDLKNDLRNTWELKDIIIIPVVIGATGLMKENLTDYLKTIPGSPSASEVQLSAIKETIKILKRALGHKSG